MQYHQDWFMRQIEEMVAMIARMVFGKETVTTTQRAQYPGLSETESDIQEKLQELIHRGQICQAEDLLFEYLSPDDPGIFRVAVAFYHQLNQLSDIALEAQNISREEILDGLKEVCRVYGFDPNLGFTE